VSWRANVFAEEAGFHLGIGYWVSFLVLLALALLANLAIRQLWRNEPGDWQNHSPGWQRGITAGFAGGWVLLLLGTTLPFFGPGHHGLLAGVAMVLFVLLSAAFFLLLLFSGTTWLFGWPKFLVPPQLRGGGPRKAKRRSERREAGNPLDGRPR